MKKTSKVVYGLGQGEESFLQEQLAKSAVEVRTGGNSNKPNLTKSILNILDGGENEIHRLAFETDPSQINNFAGVYHPKLRLVPDSVLKRIAIQDSLVSAIVRARQNHVSAFGRPRTERFGMGYIYKPNPGMIDTLTEEEKQDFSARTKRAVDLLGTCGHTEGISTEHQKTFSEFLNLATRSAVTVGRIAVEVVWGKEPGSDRKKFSHFVATDAGTIYRATTDRTGQESLRKEAYHLLCRITGKKLVQEHWNDDEYAWVQVIEGTPDQVFTSDEMKVYNFFPVPDVELDGYPVTPIDTVITAITTHINITTHNKLYFQSGRATRGMLVIKSDDASPQLIHQIKQQFNASINSASNSWRMPTFGVPTDSEINWQPIDTGGGRDMEFQYLTDMNAREIMTAFMMAPDELPGWAYLSRGTASQALSEGNNEFKLEAARDVGIRPLLAHFEDFINAELLPLIDADLAKKGKICLLGLDADTEEKEAVRIQTAAQVYLAFDDILHKVEKRPVGKEWCGEIPLNPVYKQYLDQYKTVGQVLEQFCGVKDAAKDPSLAYIPNAFWFQWQSLLMQQQQAQQQQEQAQQQPPQGPQGPQDPQGPKGQAQPDQNQPVQPAGNKPESPAARNGEGGQEASIQQQQGNQTVATAPELGKAINQAYELMTKSENSLPPEKRRILDQHKKAVENFITGFEKDTKAATKEILDIAEKLSPRSK